jgi:transketolase
VVSLPSFELFFERPQAECDTILPPQLPRLAVEAASPFGWSVLASEVVGLTTFGRSGKGPDVYRFFGMTPEAVAAAAKELLER